MNTIVEFLQECGFVITRSYGDEIVAYCPWHSDRTASLAINPKRGWHCFAGCGKGRSVKTLLEKLEPTQNLYQLFLDRFPTYFIKEYDSKKVTSPNNETKYDVEELPLAIDNPYLLQRGITNQTINAFNIKYHKAFKSIVVPIYQHGNLVGSVQRNLSGNPKYINSSGFDRDQTLFPLDKVQPVDGKVIVVEGLFDSIKAHQEGVIQTVCTFGGYVSHEQATLLGSLANTIVICPDKDVSGLKMAHKTTAILMKLGLRVEYTFAPGRAKDFGDLEDFSGLEYHSYWKLKALNKDINYMMERS